MTIKELQADVERLTKERDEARWSAKTRAEEAGHAKATYDAQREAIYKANCIIAARDLELVKLQTSVTRLTAECERMRPVMDAAVAWHRAGAGVNPCGEPACKCTECALWSVTSDVLAADTKEKP